MINLQSQGAAASWYLNMLGLKLGTCRLCAAEQVGMPLGCRLAAASWSLRLPYHVQVKLTEIGTGDDSSQQGGAIFVGGLLAAGSQSLHLEL